MRKIPFTLVLAGLCLEVFPLGVSAQSLLVVNQGDSNVSIVDPVSEKQVAVVDEGIADVHGHEIAVSADGRTAFVPIYGNTGVGKPGIDGHQMLVIDVRSRKLIGNIVLGP